MLLKETVDQEERHSCDWSCEARMVRGAGHGIRCVSTAFMVLRKRDEFGGGVDGAPSMRAFGLAPSPGVLW
eukprot:scaffold6808_cov144-Amphora_coffeaeformis.AAC.2